MTIPSDCSILGKEVPVSDIEIELKKLWEADDASTHASLMNFAVYSEDASALACNSSMVREITREHACRAILVGIDLDDPEVGMRSWITAHCNLANGKKAVCCEQIAFHLAGKVVGRYRNSIFAHLQSDLPLVFWWQGELTDRFDDRLYTLIARLIIDSAEWAEPRAQYRLLERALLQDGLVVQDLSWTRTYRVRLAIASLFDDHAGQAALPKIEKVNIVVHPDNLQSGLQLLAWMSTQCEWAFANDMLTSDRAPHSFSFQSKGGKFIEAQIVTDENSLAINEVTLSGDDFEAKVSLGENDNLIHLVFDIQGIHVEESTPAESIEPQDLVRDQLSRGGKNSLFKKVFPRYIELMDRS
ncbi:glucose-6-phosphate dehydrogenase assembly protein OpcA [Rubritalea marina]|uniref:glucose-6-phosphate dehydrogenase assembly protein OpcA n=1 Tax=Rubritalea marina TaxID=361055 RepID=UPI00036B0547|nr:glucose-6-phosphate dehydrogenase assembly protein OpcA [Rubritalea marina]